MSVSSAANVISMASRLGFRALVSGSVRQQNRAQAPQPQHTKSAAVVEFEDGFGVAPTERTTVRATPMSTRRGGACYVSSRAMHGIARDTKIDVASEDQCHSSTQSPSSTAVPADQSPSCVDAESRSAHQPPKTQRSFVTVRCGLAKNMTFGASTALDQNRYGDDACFVAKYRHTHVVGVADGVGGWWQYGYDASFFPRTLMQHCKRLTLDGKFDVKQPAKLIAEAYDMLIRDQTKSRSAPKPKSSSKRVIAGSSDDDIPSGFFGSSTACVIMLDQSTSQMHTANLGDSGFIVVRDNRIVHRSEEQCHYFNAPFQLAVTPALAPDAQGGYLSDSPSSADIASFTLQDGDCILLATDGLFDNVATSLIERELLANRVDANTTAETLQAVCNSLTLTARRLSMDQEHISPFAQKAREHGHARAIGGKPDDITLIMVVVTSNLVV